MKVFVVFDFPEIQDADSEDATFAIDSLSEDLQGLARDGEYDWYIDDAISESQLKQYIVKYYWPKNHHEVYSFVCMAENVQHAIEQCEDAYPNNCDILSVEEK
jgi:hypothetical protein